MLYPKIGIRPTIDGRWGGVRESLEKQTMGMAENAAKLISENVKYPDGTPVQCVVGCTTIGSGSASARASARIFSSTAVPPVSSNHDSIISQPRKKRNAPLKKPLLRAIMALKAVFLA